MVFRDRKNFIISSVLVASFILSPLSILVPKKANAQIPGVGIGAYATGLGPTIANLPQCQKVINSGIKSMFKGIGSLFGINAPEVPGAVSAPDTGPRGSINPLDNLELITGLETTVTADRLENLPDLDSPDTIRVSLPDSTLKLITDIKKDTQKTKESAASLNENETCLKAVGRLVIKMMLQKITLSTVNWINSGFDGKPAFVQDFDKFFSDIAKNEMLQFGVEISNPELFPFGREYWKDTILAFNNKFQDNARYSLNEMIQQTTPEYSAITFQQRFNQGGWNAWSALTQVPANNPLGFKLLADNTLSQRLAKTVQSTAENTREILAQANGFTGDLRCREPRDVTKEEENRALNAGEPSPCIGGWEYVTPGKIVAEAATNAINYPKDALLDAEDLNDAIAAILDAILGQFSSNLMEKGFAYLDDTGSDGQLYTTSYYGSEGYKTRTQRDFAPIHLASSWMKSNPDFDIRTDLTQALIDEQRTYVDKLVLQNKELLSTVDGQAYQLGGGAGGRRTRDTGESNAYGLLPTIYQLDYCIPGPHPGWETDSRRTLAEVMKPIIPETEASLKNRDGAAISGAARAITPLAGALVGNAIITSSAIGIGAALGSFAPIIGNAIGAAVGAILGAILGGPSAAEKVRQYYAGIVYALIGYLPDYDDKNESLAGNISSKNGIVNVFNEILNRYINIINKTYFAEGYQPPIAKEAAQLFREAKGYSMMMEANEERIAAVRTTIKLLQDIKEEVDGINSTYKNTNGEFLIAAGPDAQNVYEEKLKPHINDFGRLTASMVNGDDILAADSLLKQIIDKKNYVYKNLLKGEYGCEAFLEKAQPAFPAPWDKGSGSKSGVTLNVNSVKRMRYPLPILYDYNEFSAGSSLPDPFDSGYATRMPGSNSYNLYGPGFLSFVFFSGNNDPLTRGPDRLHLDDLFPHNEGYGGEGGANVNSKLRSVGIIQDYQANWQDTGPRLSTNVYAKSGTWESIIGVY